MHNCIYAPFCPRFLRSTVGRPAHEHEKIKDCPNYTGTCTEGGFEFIRQFYLATAGLLTALVEVRR